jgi:outer membrane receptor for ferrienterochelin and colicins
MNPLRLAGLAVVITLAAPAYGEDVQFTVQALHETSPIRGVSISSEGAIATTDIRGIATLSLAPGHREIRFERPGFEARSVAVDLGPGANAPLVVQMSPVPLESEVIVVTATRSGLVVGDQPTRVEALPEEEIEENLTVQPGNLSSLLTELAGVRMASTAPGLGGATLQIRGLPGRHTAALSDGLPLIDSEPAGFGLLQTPPLDLARVEVVKGVASALYGGSGLGGIMNLTSRRPGGEPELLLNRSSSGATDAVGFAGGTLSPNLGWTLTGGASFQDREDLDHDGWADFARTERWTIRPRFFYDDQAGRSLFVTAGFTREDRNGGTVPGGALPDGNAFKDALHTERLDGGAVARLALEGGRILSARVAATSSNHDRVYGATFVRDSQTTWLGESTLSGRSGNQSWVMGAAVAGEALATSDVPDVGYDYTAPALFAQDEFAVGDRIVLSASGRADFHSDYGTFFSPRLAAVFLPTESWTIRASAGAGFAAPTPFVDEIETTGLGALDPVAGLRAERATGASLDAQWMSGRWEADVSLFGSEIRHPLDLRPGSAPGRLKLFNAASPRRVLGSEVLLRYVAGALHVIGSYTVLDATEAAPGGGRRDVDRVPRQTAELGALLEDETRGRIGLELSWTGRQPLDDNPYRAESPGFFELNALVEIKIGESSIFLNAVNLTDVRQSDFDPLLRQAPGPAGQPITELWAPIAGRVFNLGVRLEF